MSVIDGLITDCAIFFDFLIKLLALFVDFSDCVGAVAGIILLLHQH